MESNPSAELILRNLLILRNDKIEKNCKNAEPRYTARTRNDRTIVAEVQYDLPPAKLGRELPGDISPESR